MEDKIKRSGKKSQFFCIFVRLNKAIVMMRYIFYYLLFINVVAFVAYGVDKWKACRGRWRISEKMLLLLAAVGGSIGALCAMQVCHHKTQHKKFRFGVPVILLLQIVAAVYFEGKML